MARATRPEVGQIEVDDRLKWRYPNGTLGEARVLAVRGYPEGSEAGPGVSFIDTAHKARDVAFAWITHWRGRKLPTMKTTTGISSVVTNPEAQLDLTLTKEESKVATKKKAAPKGQPQMKSRKSLDEMSESHRAHVEKWTPHVENLKAVFVWTAVSCIPGRGVEGPYFVAIKRGDKDYAIVEYNTQTQRVNKILDDGFETSSAMMEAFKEWRKVAKERRAAVRGTAKAKRPAKAASTTPKAKPTRKRAATTKAKPTRKRTPRAPRATAAAK